VPVIVLDVAVSDVFSERLSSWRDYTSSPWGRVRYAVVEETLRREASRLGTKLRILDVGGGDGMDALPLATAGHEVTVLDQSRRWLDEAERRAASAGVRIRTVEGDLSSPPALGEFDLVLCHFVLQYRTGGTRDLMTLADFVRPGGALSLVLPNPVGMVLRQLVTSGPASAFSELHAETRRAVLFDHDVRKVEMNELENALGMVGLSVVRRYGGRIANDLLTDNEAKNEAGYFDDLLRLELALCDREPYVRVGGMYQIIATKP
jgi:S-adenosylmethionine-dependent methyltransferase